MRRLLEADHRLSRGMRVAERPGPLRSAAAILAHSGDSWFWLIGLAAVGLLGDGYWRFRALAFALFIVIGAALVLVIKFAIRRRRPEGEWGAVYRSTDPHSFPSGHAVRAVMLAVLALGLGPLWLGVLLLAWAPLVGLARIAMGVHYLSDVLAGWVLGAIFGAAALALIF